MSKIKSIDFFRIGTFREDKSILQSNQSLIVGHESDFFEQLFLWLTVSTLNITFVNYYGQNYTTDLVLGEVNKNRVDMFVVPICSFHEQFKYANVELSSGIASELILLFQVVDRKHTNLSKLKLTMLSFLVEAFYSLKVPFCLTWTVVWICVCCINWRASLLARSSNVQIRFLFQNLLHTLAIMVGQVYLCARRQSQSNWTSRWILLLFLCQLSQLQKIITTLIKTSQVLVDISQLIIDPTQFKTPNKPLCWFHPHEQDLFQQSLTQSLPGRIWKAAQSQAFECNALNSISTLLKFLKAEPVFFARMYPGIQLIQRLVQHDFDHFVWINRKNYVTETIQFFHYRRSLSKQIKRTLHRFTSHLLQGGFRERSSKQLFSELGSSIRSNTLVIFDLQTYISRYTQFTNTTYESFKPLMICFSVVQTLILFAFVFNELRRKLISRLNKYNSF